MTFLASFTSPGGVWWGFRLSHSLKIYPSQLCLLLVAILHVIFLISLTVSQRALQLSPSHLSPRGLLLPWFARLIALDSSCISIGLFHSHRIQAGWVVYSPFIGILQSCPTLRSLLASGRSLTKRWGKGCSWYTVTTFRGTNCVAHFLVAPRASFPPNEKRHKTWEHWTRPLSIKAKQAVACFKVFMMMT